MWLVQNLGVSHWDGRKFTNFGVESGFTFFDLRTLAPNPAGGFWVGGMSTGLWHLEHGKARHVDPDLPPLLRPGIRTLMTDTTGALWIGFEQGGLAVRSRGGEITQIPLAKEGAPPLVGPLVEHGPEIWVGFRDGGFGRVVNNVFERLSGPPLQPLAATAVCAFAFESNSNVAWLATHGQGLWRYSHGELRAIKVEGGLPSNNIYSLARDREGRLWAGTDTGVFVVSLADANAWLNGRLAKLPIAAFDHRDGMRSVEAVRAFAPPVAITPAGKLWQPTHNGVVVFDTAELPPRPAPPNVVVSSLNMNGSPVPPETISLPVGAGKLEARLLAPTFLYPHRLALQYRVRPLDGEGEKPWMTVQDGGPSDTRTIDGASGG